MPVIHCQRMYAYMGREACWPSSGTKYSLTMVTRAMRPCFCYMVRFFAGDRFEGTGKSCIL